MIPRISHSRSQLVSHLNAYPDGPYSFFVSKDVYAALFDLQHPTIAASSPKGWQTSPKGMKFLWLPQLSESDVALIEDWKERFEKYVLIGLNANLEDEFNDELDFCMALDFNYDPIAEKRTPFGESRYQLKYKSSRQQAKVLGYALVDAVADLPIPTEYRESYCLSCIPAPPDELTIPRRLAKGMATVLGRDFVDALLTCPKHQMKNAAVADKIPAWRDLYDQGCVTLSDSVNGRLVVIVDDLYQSGATMWTYAEYLKSQGAAHVIGLPCVKSMRDSDNTP